MDARALFYQDSHLCRFTALVTGCHPMPDGWAVSLDRTAFYPEGGGQPWDLGTLGEAQVLAVTEQNGSIVHLCDRELPVGGEVAGCIDWPRRFDFMQQHSGEHLLSGLIHSRYGFHNVGFHMGAGVTTIDFDGVIPQEDLPSLEAAVNEAIWRDLPVRTWFASGQELEKLPYRSKRPLEGTVRLVEFPGMDLCACCGTHVARTGEIGLLKLLSWARFHQGVRMEMVCGRRALDYLSQIYAQNRLVCQTFSAKPMETGAAAQRTAQALEAAKARAAALETRCFAATASSLSGAGDVVLFEEDLSPDGVRRLADAVGNACQGRCCVFSGSDEEGYRYAIYSPIGGLQPFVQALNKALRGRGGGKPKFVQGSLSATRAEIEAYLQAAPAGAPV